MSEKVSYSMIKTNEKYIVDDSGKKSAVVLPIDEYKRLMEIVEEYEDIKEFDKRMKDPEWISLDEIKKTSNV